MNTSWICKVDQEMQEKYGISISEAGWEDMEFFDRFGHLDPTNAIDLFATKYDLSPISSNPL